jgi:multiple sugar transport system substrate-binding protein
MAMFRRVVGGIAAAALLASTGLAHAKTEYQKKFAGTELNVLAPAMPQFAALWKLLPEFEKEYGIKVKVDESPFDQTREKTLVDMQQGTGRYDVFAVDVMWLAEYAAAGFLEPVMKYVNNKDLTDPDFDLDDFLPRILSGTGVFNDTLYNIPIGAGPVGTTFRKDLAEKAGIALPPKFDPKFNTDYMRDTVKKMHKPENGIIGFANIPGRWFWGVTFLPYLYAFQTKDSVGNEYIGPDYKVTINNKNTVDAIDYYVSLKEYMPEDAANWGIGEATAAYQAGKAFGTWNYQDFIAGFFEDPKLKDIAGKNVHLHTPAGPHGVLDPWFGSWGLSISVASKQKEAAWTFIQWMTSKKQQLEAIKYGAGPTRHSTYKSAELAKYAPWWVSTYDFMLKQTNPDERVRIPEWAEISDIMGLHGNRVWIGEISSKDAAANMEKEMTAAMRKGGYYAPGAKLPPQHWRDLTYYDRQPSKWQ